MPLQFWWRKFHHECYLTDQLANATNVLRPLTSLLGMPGAFASVTASSEELQIQLSLYLTLIMFDQTLVHGQPSYVPPVDRLVLPTAFGTHTGILKLYVQFQENFRGTLVRLLNTCFVWVPRDWHATTSSKCRTCPCNFSCWIPPHRSTRKCNKRPAPTDQPAAPNGNARLCCSSSEEPRVQLSLYLTLIIFAHTLAHAQPSRHLALTPAFSNSMYNFKRISGELLSDCWNKCFVWVPRDWHATTYSKCLTYPCNSGDANFII